MENAGMSCAAAVPQDGVSIGKRALSDASICKWKAKFGGMDVSEIESLIRGTRPSAAAGANPRLQIMLARLDARRVP